MNPVAPIRLDAMRLDQLLVDREFFESRARARAAIEAGLVRVNGAVALKPAQKIGDSDDVVVDGDVHPFVSRGGVKIAAALDKFEIDPADKICLDLGASTGGFCDVLLRKGAAKIYAVDVGAGQLHKKIAAEPRIVNLEKTHAKDLTRAQVPEPVDLITCDVSFISLKKALPPALALAAPGARLIALVKPQFEVGPARIGKSGIVKSGDENTVGVAEDMSRWVAGLPGWLVQGFIESPIRGGDGNREFLLAAVKTGA